jgi:membrane protease YdiL (CAAX protease family)
MALAPDRRRGDVILGVTVVLLTAWTIGRGQFVPAQWHLATNVAVGVLVGVLGWRAELDADELGLLRRHLGAGLRYGGAVLGIVALGLTLVAALPATRGFLENPVTDVGAASMVFTVFVSIPFGTVLLEELAFRGTLLALLRRRLDTRGAVAVCSVLFGLWHVSGVVRGAADDATTLAVIGAVIGTVVTTTVAGVGFCWLRLRSGSLAAPALAHIATNSLTFAAAWAVVR